MIDFDLDFKTNNSKKELKRVIAKDINKKLNDCLSDLAEEIKKSDVKFKIMLDGEKVKLLCNCTNTELDRKIQEKVSQCFG